MLRSLSAGLLATAAYVALIVVTAQDGNSETIKDNWAMAYKSAMEVMNPDSYLVYRVADGIITANT